MRPCWTSGSAGRPTDAPSTACAAPIETCASASTNCAPARRATTRSAELAADGTLTDHEFTANAALIVGAGFETTVNLIGNGIVLLLEHPDQLARLRDEPRAVAQRRRGDPAVRQPGADDRAHRELRLDIAGQHIAAGDMVALLLGGANRDPRVFADPGRFDITRANARDHWHSPPASTPASVPRWPASKESPRCERSSRRFPICGSPHPRNGGD